VPHTPAENKYLSLARQIRETQTPPPCEDSPDLFYPDGFEALTRSAIKAAKEICIGCPYRKACLDYALTAQEQYGIWGGLTVEERNQLLRPRSAPATPRQQRDNNPI
jgi:WhiB family redox-sensing transcriptional regulator